MATRAITVQLPTGLVRNIDGYAERLGRSRSSIVKEALGNWVDREAERDRLTRQALESVDAGRLIDHDRVEEVLVREPGKGLSRAFRLLADLPEDFFPEGRPGSGLEEES